MPDEYVTGFFFCLLSSLWKQLRVSTGERELGILTHSLRAWILVFFSDVEFC